MNPINILPRKILFFLALVSFLLLASCGSYQYSGYGSDGIYGETSRMERPNQYQNANQESNQDYYQTLFAEEAALYGDVLAEGAIFTDVESYSSTGNYQPGEQQASNFSGGNAPWGFEPDSYSVNIINTGFYGGFFNPYWGGGLYAFDPFWGPGFYGPGFYGPGFWGPGHWGPGFWGHPWAVGYGGFGFRVHPFFFGAGGWNNPYGFYGNRFYNYNRNNVAFNTGRRETSSSYRSSRTANLRNATNLDQRGRTSSYSRSIRNLRNSNDEYGITRRTISRDYQTRANTDNPYRNARSSQSIYRSSRSSDVFSRPSANTGRSSGTMRSSSTPRSSGTSGSGRSSSGSSGRGRGN